MADFIVRQHSWLASELSWVSRRVCGDSLVLRAVRGEQGERLPIEGDAHEEFIPRSALRDDIFHGEVLKEKKR